MANLDTITKEARFSMVLGLKTDAPHTASEGLDRIFEFGTFNGRPSKLVIVAAQSREAQVEDTDPKPCTEAEFDALVAQYDEDDRWSRVA